MFPLSQGSAFSEHNNIPSELFMITVNCCLNKQQWLSIVVNTKNGSKDDSIFIHIRYDTETIVYNEKRPILKHIKHVERYISYKEYFPLGQRISYRSGWPLTPYIVEARLEFLILLPPPLGWNNYRHVLPRLQIFCKLFSGIRALDRKNLELET